jgi:hypothetical protein
MSARRHLSRAAASANQLPFWPEFYEWLLLAEGVHKSSCLAGAVRKSSIVSGAPESDDAEMRLRPRGEPAP